MIKKPTPSQSLVESTVIEWYEAKHRRASKEEIDFINSINIVKCPYCKGTHFKKDGHRKMVFKSISVMIALVVLIH